MEEWREDRMAYNRGLSLASLAHLVVSVPGTPRLCMDLAGANDMKAVYGIVEGMSRWRSRGTVAAIGGRYKPAAALWLRSPKDGTLSLEFLIENNKAIYNRRKPKDALKYSKEEMDAWVNRIMPEDECDLNYKLCQLRLKRGQGNTETCWLVSIVNGIIQDQRLFNHLRTLERASVASDENKEAYALLRNVMNDTTTDVLPTDLLDAFEMIRTKLGDEDEDDDEDFESETNYGKIFTVACWGWPKEAIK
jgi:hypothetical protein